MQPSVCNVQFPIIHALSFSCWRHTQFMNPVASQVFFFFLSAEFLHQLSFAHTITVAANVRSAKTKSARRVSKYDSRGPKKHAHVFTTKKCSPVVWFRCPRFSNSKKWCPIQPCLHSGGSFTSFNAPQRSCLERGENTLESNCPALWRRLLSARQRTFSYSLGGKVCRILFSRMEHLSLKQFARSWFLACYGHGSDVAARKWMLSATELWNLTWAFPLAVGIFLHGGHSSADGERNSTAMATFSNGQTVLRRGKLLQMASALANHPAHRIPRVATLQWSAPRQILWWRAHSSNSLMEIPQWQIGKSAAANSLTENLQRQILCRKTHSCKETTVLKFSEGEAHGGKMQQPS